MAEPFKTYDLYTRWCQNPLIDIVFQPLVHIPSHRVFGYEALSRPKMGREHLSIGDLLESAAQHHRLSDFDRIAVPEILRAASLVHWPDDVFLFINFSPLTISDPTLLFKGLADAAITIRPSQIVIEISEREAMIDTDFSGLLLPYRQAGMMVALDDYGAGYSGLTRIVDLEPDFVKIDLQLVRDIDSSPVKYALAESTVQFSQRVGHLHVLAEGIETQAELVTLNELGVQYGQGYLLGRPAAALQPISPNFTLPSARRPTPNVEDQLQSLLTTARRMADGMASGDGLLSHIVHLALRLTQADSVSWWTPEGGILSVGYSIPSLPQHLRHFDLNPQVASYQAMTQRRVIVFQTQEECQKNRFGRHLNFGSMMVVPVSNTTETTSLLVLGFRDALQIRPPLVQLMEGLANLIALVTTSSKENSGTVGEPLFEALASLVSSTDLDSLLAKVIDAALSVSGAHLGYIGLLTDTELHAVTPDKETFDLPREEVLSLDTEYGRGPIGRTLRGQESLVIPDITQDPSVDPWLDDMLSDGIHAVLGVPLLSGGQCLGLLKVYHSQGFEAGRVRRVEALASLATSVIESWQDRHNPRRQILRTKSLPLANILHQLLAMSSSQEILCLLKDSVISFMDGQTGGVLLKGGDDLVPLDDASGLPPSPIPEIVQRSLERRCLVLEPQSPHGGIFALPLISGDRSWGAIWVVLPQSDEQAQTQLMTILEPHLMFVSLVGAGAVLLSANSRD